MVIERGSGVLILDLALGMVILLELSFIVVCLIMVCSIIVAISCLDEILFFNLVKLSSC